MKSILLIISISIISNLLFGQFNETIRAGRPGQAIGAFSLGEKVIQIQSGIMINQIDEAMTETHSLSENTVIRLGIFEKFEISGVINWQTENIMFNGTEVKRKGISDTQFGGRINILENKGAVPAIGLQGRVLLKVQNNDFKRENLGSIFILATGNKITDWLSMGTNFGVVWSGNNTDPTSLYILNFSYGITEKIGGFTELYGNFNDFATNYDAGISILVNDNLQLDFSGGWQGDNGRDDWFLDAGVSWRFHWREKIEK